MDFEITAQIDEALIPLAVALYVIGIFLKAMLSPIQHISESNSHIIGFSNSFVTRQCYPGQFSHLTIGSDANCGLEALDDIG